MANYSKDSDLTIYEQDLSSINFDLAPYHAEAKKEIDRRLRARGLTNTQIDDMSAQTLIDLVSVACSYVLHLAYNSIGAHEASKMHYANFRDKFGETKIEVDADGDTVPETTFSGGTISLG